MVRNEADGSLESEKKEIRRSLSVVTLGEQIKGASWLARCNSQISAIDDFRHYVGRVTVPRATRARPDAAGSMVRVLSPLHLCRFLRSLEMDFQHAGKRHPVTGAG